MRFPAYDRTDLPTTLSWDLSKHRRQIDVGTAGSGLLAGLKAAELIA